MTDIKDLESYIVGNYTPASDFTFVIYSDKAPYIGDKILVGDIIYLVENVVDTTTSLEREEGLSYSRVFLCEYSEPISLKELENEVEPFKNTLVLNLFEVVRLVGVEYIEDDYFWIFDTQNGVIYSPCVMGWHPLKGVLPEDKYALLVDIWNLNNFEKAI